MIAIVDYGRGNLGSVEKAFARVGVPAVVTQEAAVVDDAEAVVLAEASKHVIVTAETIVDQLTEKEATGTFVPGILVDAVAHAPFGAHPAGCDGLYAPDKAHMARYVAASKDDDAFAEYLQACVFGVKDHGEYVQRFVPLDWREGRKVGG